MNQFIHMRHLNVIQSSYPRKRKLYGLSTETIVQKESRVVREGRSRAATCVSYQSISASGQ